MPPTAIMSTSSSTGIRIRSRSGSRRRVLAGSVRSTAVASPVEVPVREASAASASSRSSSSVCASGWRWARSLSVMRSSTAASRAETSGRMIWTSGQVLAHVLHRDGHLVLAVEGDVPDEHLVEHDAERVDVGLPVDVVAERLLGRDVVRRAEHAAVGGQPLLLQRAGDAEVGDLGGALLVDEDVLRLDVAVDDAARVRGAERAGDLDRVGDRLVDRQAPHAADPLLERLALDVLEDDVGPAVLLARVDHADDVRVVELGDGARLAPEALELVGVRRDLAVHELDRDLALERRVERAIDRRHPTGADLGVEAVAAVEARADQRAHDCAHIVADDRGVEGALLTALRRPFAAAPSEPLRMEWQGPPGRLERVAAMHRQPRPRRKLVAWGRARCAGWPPCR